MTSEATESNVTALTNGAAPEEPPAAEGAGVGEAQKEALRSLWDGLEVDPRYTASEPSIRAAVMLGGVIAAGTKSPSLLNALEGEEEGGEMGLNFAVFFLAAMDSPKTQDAIYQVLAEIWDRKVENAEIDQPIDDWEYDPTPEQVKEGLPSREQRWRMYSRKNRKRMLKRFEVEELPFVALLSFAKSLTEREIADFFTLLYSVVREKLGSSSTESSDGTPPGPTEG